MEDLYIVRMIQIRDDVSLGSEFCCLHNPAVHEKAEIPFKKYVKSF